jgi:protein CpxP
MKKQFFLSAMALLISVATIKAQSGGGYQHQTVQERVSNTMSKLAPLQLDAATSVKADSIFTDFYTAQQQMMQNMMANGGQVDRSAMKTQRQQLAADRDSKLKAIFTDDQYNKWKNDIEPSLRPQRGNGQGGQQQQ